jgi:hypothetical protein
MSGNPLRHCPRPTMRSNEIYSAAGRRVRICVTRALPGRWLARNRIQRMTHATDRRHIPGHDRRLMKAPRGKIRALRLPLAINEAP